MWIGITLSSSQPVITKENILLIERIYDPLVSSGPDEIRQKWGRPEIWRLPHGHIGICSELVQGLDRPCRALANTPAGCAHRLGTIKQSCRIMPSDKDQKGMIPCSFKESSH
jgi:hypothetical protein